MVWISLLFFALTAHAGNLPSLMTKHVPESLRFISMDGRYAYVTKTSGVLGVVSSFRSTDFISEPSTSDFIVKGSRFRQRLAIEVVPGLHTEMSLLKNHKILVVNAGESKTTEIGQGKNAKLHLQDEWISYFNPIKKTVHIQNVVTQKRYDINLSLKSNPFYVPDVEMVNSNTVVYTDVNELGLVALISYNLTTRKSNIIYKATRTGTRLEVCQNQDYLAFGEFPYEGVTRGSKIMHIKLINGAGVNLVGYETLYSSVDQDLGNMLCLPDSLYFIKTKGQDPVLHTKSSDVARLEIKTTQMSFKTNMGNVTQLVEMDGRILLPFRGNMLVVEGISNLGVDTLKSSSPQTEFEP